MAALGVFFAHGFFLYQLFMPAPFPGHSLGSLSVYVFFFISGYLVFQSWAREPVWINFWVKRVFRIFPGLMVAVGFSVFVLGWLMTTADSSAYWSSSETWANFFNNATGLATIQTLPGVFESNPFARAVNGSLWTIRYEIAMYLVLAILALLTGGHRLVWVALSLVLAAVWWVSRSQAWDTALAAQEGWRAAVFRWHDFTGFGVPFFWGSAFAAYRVRCGWWMLGGALLAAVIAFFTPSDMLRQLAVWTMVALGVFYFAHAGADEGTPRARGGMDISYGVYIYAFPIQQAAAEWGLRRGWPLSMYLLTSLVMVLLLAWLSWIVVERPSIRWGHRLLERRRVLRR